MSLSLDEREDPWGQDRRPPSVDELVYLRDMTPGADEHHVPLHPSVADRTWGEAAEDEAGEA